MDGWLATRTSPDETVRLLLEKLLHSRMVDALLVPLRTPDGRGVVHTLVRDPGLLERTAPLAPVLPVSGGTVLGRLTATGAPGRIGAVLRNCELRAAVELSKVLQVSLDGVLLVAVDCLGTYDVPTYAQQQATGGGSWREIYEQLQLDPTAQLLPPLRPGCSMCERPIPGLEDSYTPHIAVGLLGVPVDERLWVSTHDTVLGELLGLEAGELPAGRSAAVKALIAARSAERDRRFAAFRARMETPAAFAAEFATCIRCQNCMVACPICYCKECVFRTDVFDHPSARYWDWAERKGAAPLPPDRLLFHLTRMLHMAHACVGCGLCSDACPVGIPVADVFRAVGQSIQRQFGYVPGRDPAEEMIVGSFREDELQDMG